MKKMSSTQPYYSCVFVFDFSCVFVSFVPPPVAPLPHILLVDAAYYIHCHKNVSLLSLVFVQHSVSSFPPFPPILPPSRNINIRQREQARQNCSITFSSINRPQTPYWWLHPPPPSRSASPASPRHRQSKRKSTPAWPGPARTSRTAATASWPNAREGWFAPGRLHP